MKRLFSPNIGKKDRVTRCLMALILLAGGWFAVGLSFWLCLALVAAGVFVLFEAFRGWCALRACGIKTKL